MKTNLSLLVRATALTALILTQGLSIGHGALIAADDFLTGGSGYPGGNVNLANINPSTSVGFTGGWQGDTTAFFVSSSSNLSFPGVQNSGGSLAIIPTSNGNFSRAKGRSFAAVADSSQLWFSTLYRPGSNAFDANREMMMGFLSDRLPAGGQSSYDGAIWTNGNGGALSGFSWGLITGDEGSAALTVKYQSGADTVLSLASGFNLQLDTTYLLMAQLAVNAAGNDELNIWALTSQPLSQDALGAPVLTINSADLLANSAEIDTLAIWAGETLDTPNIQQVNTFDAVRIGTTFQSVAPEPSRALLLLLAGAGLALKRGRWMRRVVMVAFAGLVLMPGIQAALISYEGFNYTAGSGLSGSNPGAGWNGAWASNGTVVAGSLAYPAGTGYTPTGNRLSHTSMGSSTLSASIQYGTDFRYSMNSDMVRYASFLAAKPTAAPGNEFLQVQMGEWLFGMSSGEAFLLRSFDSVLGVNVEAYSASVIQPDTTYLLVSKLVTSTSGKDRIYLNWYAPGDTVPLAEPVSWMLSIEVNNTSAVNQSSLSFSSGNGAGAYTMDELRLGTAWADVAAIPEPGRILLILGGSLGLFIRRRRA